jgi:hypothetical protein
MRYVHSAPICPAHFAEKHENIGKSTNFAQRNGEITLNNTGMALGA